MAGFFDAGINKIVRADQLRLNPSRVTELNAAFPQAGFQAQAKDRSGTQAIRSVDRGRTSGDDARRQRAFPALLGVQPAARPDSAPAAGGGGPLVIPESGDIHKFDSTIRNCYPVRRKTHHVPFLDRADLLKIRYHEERYRRDMIKNSRSLIRL